MINSLKAERLYNETSVKRKWEKYKGFGATEACPFSCGCLNRKNALFKHTIVSTRPSIIIWYYLYYLIVSNKSQTSSGLIKTAFYPHFQ